jgi:uncharacterized membrane protein YcaP (DUF421 family)
MNLGAIAIRVLFAYLFLLAIVRVSGKRTVRQVTPLDFTASIIVGDLVDDLLWAEVPAAQFTVAVVVLLSLAVAVSVGTASSAWFSRLVLGAPREVASSGELVTPGTAAERVTDPDLFALLRGHKVDDLREVERANLETNGALGLVQAEWAKEARKADLDRVLKAAGEEAA